jgi:uncharacterized protein YqjF (DUF2071 family)
MQSTFLTAEWRKLAIANYSVDPRILTPYLPYKTELDIWNGKCYVSLVGFCFIKTRVLGISIPFHKDFEEINLRFYVRFKQDGVWKRGVTFIKEIVPKPVLAFIANSIYREKYVSLPTKHEWLKNGESIKSSYAWKHGGEWDSISVIADKQSIGIPIGSEEEFITEHYWGYTQLNDRQTSEYRVEHPKWEVYPITDHKIRVRFPELYGSSFASLQDRIPDSVMLAEGSAISVRKAKRIQ